VVCGKRKYDHVSADFKRLGWLNAEQLTTYHRLCLIKRVITTESPAGIAEQFLTTEHEHDTRTRGQLRRLSFSGADLFNKLPQAIRDVGVSRFKTSLTEWLLRDTG